MRSCGCCVTFGPLCYLRTTMRILTLNGRQRPNYMSGAMGAGPEENVAMPDEVAQATGELGELFRAEGSQGSAPGKVFFLVKAMRTVVGWIRQLGTDLGWGPNYDPNNGGELRRQLQSQSLGADRWTDVAIDKYGAWLAAVGGGIAQGTPFDQRWNPCSTFNAGPLGINSGNCFDIWTADGYNPSQFVARMQLLIPGWDPRRAAIDPTPEQDQTLRTIALQRLGAEGPTAAAQASVYYGQLDYDWQRLVDAYQNAYAASVTPAADPTAPPTAPTPPPDAEQLQILQSIAIALAGFAGADQQAQAVQLYGTLPASWRALVDSMQADLLATNPPPPTPTTTTNSLTPLLLLGAAALLLK